jgi:hypothetical protein
MAPVSIEFTARNSGPHMVVLEFPWPIDDAGLRKLVDDARATTGSDQAPPFQFSWQLMHAGRVVSQRPSPLRSTASIDIGTSGLGGGPLKSLGLAFGGFELTAGEIYTLRVLPDYGFDVIARGRPRIVVEQSSFGVRQVRSDQHGAPRTGSRHAIATRRAASW